MQNFLSFSFPLSLNSRCQNNKVVWDLRKQCVYTVGYLFFLKCIALQLQIRSLAIHHKVQRILDKLSTYHFGTQLSTFTITLVNCKKELYEFFHFVLMKIHPETEIILCLHYRTLNEIPIKKSSHTMKNPFYLSILKLFTHIGISYRDGL